MNRNVPRAAAGVVAAALAAATGSTILVDRGRAAGTASAKVTIVNSGSHCASFFCFRPKVVTIVNNSTVTWSDQSGVTHSIARCSAAVCSGHGGGSGTDTGFGTAGLGSGQVYSFAFDAPGTYVYYCTIHGYSVMHGTVSVH